MRTVRDIRIKALPADRPRSPDVRLLDTALELFYLEGIRAIGIDRLIAEADVAKASFYSHFGSKNGLILAYVDAHSGGWLSWMGDSAGTGAESEIALGRFFKALRQLFSDPDYRGCAFANALADVGDEVPGLAARCQGHKRAVADYLADLGSRMNVRDARRFAEQMLLVVDGAMATAARERNPAAADRARELVESVLGRPLR